MPVNNLWLQRVSNQGIESKQSNQFKLTNSRNGSAGLPPVPPVAESGEQTLAAVFNKLKVKHSIH